MATRAVQDDPVTAPLARFDRDRTLATFLAPLDRRPALWALLAFNLEIARVREQVSQPILGQIRLQWWRDAVAEIYGARTPGGGPVRRHAVVEALATAVARHDLTRTYLDRLIDARERDLDDTPFATLAALESYAEATTAPLLALQIEVLRTGEAGGAFTAAREIGIGWALAGLIRAVPFQASRQRILIPVDLAQAADLHESGVTPGSAALATAITPIAAAARDWLARGRRSARGVPAAVLPPLLIGRIGQAYLARLAVARHDPYDARVQIPDPLASFRLIWGRLCRRA